MKGKKKFFLSLAALVAVIVICSILLSVTGGYAVYTANTNKRKLPVYGVERDDNSVSISFDCAWGADYTEKILDTLDFYKVKATFFVVEFWTEKYPEVLKKIVDRGHEVGTHSKTHPKMSKLSVGQIETELKSSVEAIEKITEKKVTLFRPPFGDYDDEVIETAEKLGLKTIQWSVDSLDWKDLSAEQIAVRVIGKTKSGSIILMHNNGLHTLESLPLIFTDLQRKGFVFRPIGELIYTKDYEIAPDGTQRKINI